MTIPVAVKLSPFFSSLAHLAQRLDDAGADGLVLFNRFYQPDIDPEMLLAVPRLHLSKSEELLLRLRWLAILYGRVARVARRDRRRAHRHRRAQGGHGRRPRRADGGRAPETRPRPPGGSRRELAHWLEEHEYDSLEQAQGSMSLLRCPDPDAFERGNYLRILQTWRPPPVR